METDRHAELGFRYRVDGYATNFDRDHRRLDRTHGWLSITNLKTGISVSGTEAFHIA